MARKVTFVLLLLAFSSIAISFPVSYQYPQLWSSWKIEHGKNYSTERENLERHLVWLSNKKYIDSHNSYSHIFGYTLGLNQFADLTDSEFKSHFTSSSSDSLPPPPPPPPTTHPPPQPPVSFGEKNYTDLPEYMDWRTMNAVSAVADEYKCVSCYSFAALGALEGAISLATGKLTKLSPQSVVDCSLSYGNHGCSGGKVENTYAYIIDNGGIDLDSYYSYTGRQESCMASVYPLHGSMSGMVRIPEGDEVQLKNAVATVGPVAAAVDATSAAFRFYKSGILDIPIWYKQHAVHAVLITGYGIVNDKKYWIVRNSWGHYWGNKGFILLSRDRYNQLGIASTALFPTL